MDQEFIDELNTRISILNNPEFDDPSTKGLGMIDYVGVALLIVLSLLIFAWGWY
ncbi:hypothetical protein ACQCN2_05620 [Brevibacillus ginsengisoli]|uniref:hypothetical protein n=1 Tax=Brevibacillus ginsengisoli TaxID=363854 RepID=UPI003CE73ADD